MLRRGVLVMALVGLMAAPAQATVRTGTGTDPAGDAAAGYDVVGADAQADDATGLVTVTVRLAAAPSGWVVALIGTGTDCGAPYALFLGKPSTGAAAFGRDSGQTGPATMTVSGSTVGITATDPSLAVPFDCAEAGSSPDGNALNDASSPFALTALAPPAPTPVPTVVPAPATTKAAVPPVPVPKAAKLTASLGGVPSTIKRNRTIALKLVLANDGSKPTGSVSVALSRPRGLSFSRAKVKVAKLKPAQKRTLKLKLKLTKKARVSTTFKVTARSGKLKAASSVLLKLGKAKKLSPKAPRGQTKKSPIAGTYWWRTVNHVDYAWDNRAFYFVDDTTVYSGLPAGGLPATCTTPPAKPDLEVDQRDGCLPYSYDEKTGALTIGDKTGTFKPGARLVLDGNSYSATQIPAAGATFAFNEHEHFDFSGMCGLILGCTVTKKFLTMTPDGQFVLSHSTTATTGDPGLGPFTAVGSYPPDQHGTYQVLPGGRIHLAFADGTARDETFAVLTNDDTLAPDPAGEGVFVGADNYYPDPFP
jgi:hypothetical protein